MIGLRLAALAAAAALATGSAQATTLFGEASGTAYGLFDGAQVTDLTFTATYSYILDGAIRELYGDTDHALGGPAYSAPDLFYATITFGAVSHVLTGATSSVALQNSTVVQQEGYRTPAVDYGFRLGAAHDEDPNQLADVSQPPAGNLCAAATCYGFFSLGSTTVLYLLPDTYTITLRDTPPVVSPAPEPSAWAMMLLGFAGAGAALRRRPAIA